MASKFQTNIIKNINQFFIDWLAGADDGLVEKWNDNSAEFEKEMIMLLPSNGKTKKYVDPNRPKKGTTVYRQWYRDNYATIKNKMESDGLSVDVNNVRTEIGLSWNEFKLSDNEEVISKRKEYEEVASNERKVYMDGMKEYTPTKEKPKKAKRPPTAYQLWSAEERPKIKEQFPSYNNRQISAELGNRWKEFQVSDDEGDKIRIENIKLEVDSIKNNDTPPVKGAITGYILFCQKQRERMVSENKGCTGSEITKMLNDAWKSLSSDEQDEYKATVSNMAV